MIQGCYQSPEAKSPLKYPLMHCISCVDCPCHWGSFKILYSPPSTFASAVKASKFIRYNAMEQSSHLP